MFFELLRVGTPAVFFAILIGYVVALVVGFCFHEAAHAYVATKQGDPTPKIMGRLTLNPIRHIDWLGLVMLLLVGFGYAKPVPVNPKNFKNGRNSDFLVSSAGIFVNICLAIVFCFVQSAIRTFAPHIFASDNFFAILLQALLYYGIFINLSLAFFNLIPIPPLDGFRMLDAVVGRRHYKFIEFMQKYSFVFMIIIMVVVMFGFNFIGYFTTWTNKGITWVFDKFFGLFVR